MKYTAKSLRQFEAKVKKLWEKGAIKVPVHLSGGNEEYLLGIFKNLIKKGDYVFSNHRNHYHYLLHGGKASKLIANMTNGRMGSMNTCDKGINFYSSAIVGGCCGIAVGVAKALKANRSSKRVWCFVGDAVLDGGHFWEALQYTQGYDLPLMVILEDNDRSTCTTIPERLGSRCIGIREHARRGIKMSGYSYTPTYPHVGSGKYVQF